MKELLKKVWPWKKFEQYEQEIAALKDLHEQLHQQVKTHKATIGVRDGHIRKMATIIAIKGGILG